MQNSITLSPFLLSYPDTGVPKNNAQGWLLRMNYTVGYFLKPFSTMLLLWQFFRKIFYSKFRNSAYCRHRKPCIWALWCVKC